ncbi:MAG: diphthine--ammonia ligase [Methanomassiliicoccales archaeon]|nr:diphthine--ammonia ligase [Methanomassiliicoccales archaeon]
MRLAVLFSGGKDSTYAAFLMHQLGHEVRTMVSILPKEEDSWLFHTPNLHLLPQMARAMGLDLLTVESEGGEEGDLAALRSALKDLDVEGVVTGAIVSDYQWDRINGVCEELGLRVFSPLWRKDQEMLLRDMVQAGVRAVFVRVSAEGLAPSWLGREIDPPVVDELVSLSRRWGMNVSGEGGEYETLVLDSPLHRHPLKAVGKEVVTRRDGGSLRVLALEEG